MKRKHFAMIMMTGIALYSTIHSIKQGLPVIPSVLFGIMLIGMAYIMRDAKNIFEVIKPLILWIMGCLGLIIASMVIITSLGFF